MKVELLYITPEPEKVIEKAGRVAHQSFDKETPDSHIKFIRMLIKLGHTSVLEHAVASFKISGVSRSLTHQLVRHRIASYTQKSQRYVDESTFEYVTPDKIKENEVALNLYNNFMNYCKETYKKLKELGIPKEDARFVLPNATKTEIVLTANLREFRHMISLRGSKEAQWEIRRMFIEILKILKEYAPTVFEDFIIENDYVRCLNVEE
ncbi:MAG TPA: FAD-dependent thymidylate synthase [Caldisericia bacterium]|nr:FAD-dependent thymidylate synthase [Caldisericia bacterium]HOL83052.1 FAD-dependent thymidylate synthase [Caldisericia bacterium]HON82512.1 FAD-dependent thymidylate synthase [Caldisericia bacterium]HPC56650.1 FAD-dependent thymidylate synthase [Caldisericia bacterium]HPP43595.1 FAD-dependent thymidylate synthase [Caldisericia bacterium]